MIMKYISIFLFSILTVFVRAQESEMVYETSVDTLTSEATIGKNIIKTNLTSLVINNYSFQYERILSKRWSASLSYRFMPKSNLPFKDRVTSNFADDDEYLKELFNSLEISNSALTPEIRFYLGEGYGKGFYVAGYYRYNKVNIGSINYYFDSEYDGQTITVSGSGEFTSHSAGLMLGAQWNLGKRFVLDWWIIGAHTGSMKGELNGTPDRDLGLEDQQFVMEDISNIDLYDVDVEVSTNRVKAKIKGPWYGIRAGLSIGYRF